MGGLLLIAERDTATRETLAEICRAQGHEVVTATSRRELVDRLHEVRPIAVLAGAEFTGDGAAIRAHSSDPAPPVVLLTGTGTESGAGDAGEAAPGGAVDVLVHPVTPRDLALCLGRLARLHRLRSERDELRAGPAGDARGGMAGPSAEAGRLRELVQRVAGTPRSTVLITGEVGVEKELVARAIHGFSARAAGPFRVHPCGTEDPVRFHTLLVGDGEREGLLAQAAGGTLFLEEVSDLPAASQDQLGVLLRDRAFLPGDGGPERPLDVRLVASTRFDLEARTEEGLFRGDLYYRLNVLMVPVPPLRERREDLPELTRLVLRGLPLAAPGGLPSLTPATWDRLAAHDWPGNLRELRATLARAAFAARGGDIQPGHLGLQPPRAEGEAAPHADSSPALPLGDRSLRTMEENLIRRVLEEEGGNRSRAARVLGINRSTLYNKLRQYGI